MHELGITEGIIERARSAARGAGGVRVLEVSLAITPAADFTRESIEMYFEMLTADDAFFRGARIVWQELSAQATCLACGYEFEAREAHAPCPRCGSTQVRYAADSPMIQLRDVSIAEEGDELEGGGA